MRYPAPEKAEIIKLVEQSHQSVRKTLELYAVRAYETELGF